MLKQNKKITGTILIIVFLPLLACVIPRTVMNFIKENTNDNPFEDEISLNKEYDLIAVPDVEYESTGQMDLHAAYSCTINTGSYYDLYVGHMQGSKSTVHLAKIEFDLENSYPVLYFDFLFHGKATIPRIDSEGNIYGEAQYEDLEVGVGEAIWENNYFYGSIDGTRDSFIIYQEETTGYQTDIELGGFGALIPNGDEIHLCTDNITKDLFDIIKLQPFDQLREACVSDNYFICTPQ